MTRQIQKVSRDASRDPLPRVLERKMIRLRPTGYGLAFIAVLAVMLAGSIRYNNNLGFLLSFLLGSMAIVSCRHTRRNLEGIKIVSCRTAPVFAGESSAFDLVADPGRFRRHAVRFVFEHTDSMIADLAAGNRSTLSLRSPPLKRGMFFPGSLRVASRYPLGLFAATATLRPEAACPVYPMPIPGPFSGGRQGGGDRGEGNGALDAGAEDFQGLKAYEPGAPLQLISWKALSRGMGLYTKEFVSTVGAAVCFDWFQLVGMDDEKRLGRLCDMVLGAQQLNLPFGMRLPGETIRPGTGRAHGQRCLLELALYEPGGKPRWPQPQGQGG
jgi:uncharacterized protein (DUF58 family)